LTEILLQEKADPNETRGTDITPLHWAVRNKHNYLLKLPLDIGADPNQQYDEFRFWRWIINKICNIYLLPLGMAASTNNIEAIEGLLEHGANVNEEMRKPSMNTTALLVVLLFGHVEAVKILLANGAYVNIDINFWTTHGKGHSELLKMAIDAGSSKRSIQEGLIASAYAGDYDRRALFLEYGANINGLTFPCDPNHERSDHSNFFTAKSSTEGS